MFKLAQQIEYYFLFYFVIKTFNTTSKIYIYAFNRKNKLLVDT